MEEILKTIITVSGTVIVAGLSVVSVYIQTRSKQKTEIISQEINAINTKFTTITNDFNEKLLEFKEESREADEDIKNKLSGFRFTILKAYLTNELSKILTGAFVPTADQRKMLHEAFDKYTEAGGNSWVKEMFDECIKRGLL